MKKLIFFVLLITGMAFVNKSTAQVAIPDPPGTVFTTNPDGFIPNAICGTAGGDIIGEPSDEVGDDGTIFRYTNPGWPAYSADCALYGMPDVLLEVIDGNSAGPPSACTGAVMANATYNAGLSNLSTGTIVYEGTTNYEFIRTNSATITTTNTFRVTVEFFQASTTTPISVIYDAATTNRLYIPANQDFDMRVYITAQSPTAAESPQYCVATAASTFYGAIELFDRLATTNPIICTSFNAGSFYETSVTASASTTPVAMPVDEGTAVTLNGSGTGVAPLAYNWTGPVNYPNTQNPSIASATLGTDDGLYTLTVNDFYGCPNTATATVSITPPVPTLGEWGLIIFTLLLLNMAIIFVVRRKKTTIVASS